MSYTHPSNANHALSGPLSQKSIPSAGSSFPCEGLRSVAFSTPVLLARSSDSTSLSRLTTTRLHILSGAVFVKHTTREDAEEDQQLSGAVVARVGDEETTVVQRRQTLVGLRGGHRSTGGLAGTCSVVEHRQDLHQLRHRFVFASRITGPATLH